MTTETTPNTSAGQPAPLPASHSALPPAGNGKRRRALLILLVITLLAGISWTAYYLLVARWQQDTDDAYVQGNVVSITPQTMGTVVAINADDGMRVSAGQVLVQLDPNDAKVALEQAQANLAATVRQVRGLYSSVDSAQADIAAREVALSQARADVARRSGLVASGAVSAEELAHAQTQLKAMEAALAGSRGQLARTHALVDATTVSDQPQVQAAAAQLRQAYLNEQRAAIVAPVDGYVAKRSVQLGQRVQPGATLMAIIPLQQVWVDANFKETQLHNLRLGQPVKLTADMYGDTVAFNGKVASLGLGTGSAFALLPAQNASGNWIKIVQRVPVRITLDPRQLREHPLRLGMSMAVKVNVHDQSLPVLPAAAATQPVLATEAYAKQLHDADAMITAIVEKNLPGHKN
ncbi:MULTISPECIES: efflux RND transporter periplasmic adaptor subunit [Thermomonas]|jgi:membrane fusion protein (multidrug efflux system)|uniref:Efflux RND transporter periplasmic adaptor subunit n=1 Tax=Thermomonas beijingensis TaxID=2872701 RepID=A0ABS7TFD0_9GAMM|nr:MULTISPECIES: efflux RND transporter periplasmic adaptor subunit [Thermomonas]MBS0460642.1 efflux RND transporter periplasmic adaptor subunit [Pseudomonadota bacterium]MBZ4186548.1 efflux RND transporter periplasmic adaptor subunit [Thermomonas beijingensis]HOC10501.1 efflux RND transporter periplasmic adaptor subunit [Thermomonas sp.]HQA01898.1 efflux RND transporter periplasmic adaptor subunit [Thermomonas sp.]HQE07828.1 efflux RND transporter periplasmic adaptor subunit [Thermomonas sp.]